MAWKSLHANNGTVSNLRIQPSRREIIPIYQMLCELGLSCDAELLTCAGKARGHMLVSLPPVQLLCVFQFSYAVVYVQLFLLLVSSNSSSTAAVHYSIEYWASPNPRPPPSLTEGSLCTAIQGIIQSVV